MILWLRPTSIAFHNDPYSWADAFIDELWYWSYFWFRRRDLFILPSGRSCDGATVDIMSFDLISLRFECKCVCNTPSIARGGSRFWWSLIPCEQVNEAPRNLSAASHRRPGKTLGDTPTRLMPVHPHTLVDVWPRMECHGQRAMARCFIFARHISIHGQQTYYCEEQNTHGHTHLQTRRWWYHVWTWSKYLLNCTENFLVSMPHSLCHILSTLPTTFGIHPNR